MNMTWWERLKAHWHGPRLYARLWSLDQLCLNARWDNGVSHNGIQEAEVWANDELEEVSETLCLVRRDRWREPDTSTGSRSVSEESAE